MKIKKHFLNALHCVLFRTVGSKKLNVVPKRPKIAPKRAVPEQVKFLIVPENTEQ